ncbi:sulfatase-like hydrolase/transferase [endosymbiont 'TC1' of Trimyema compressum]|uniref:sulfatase-like hydrolase/transferase n=1 Tax=endosymbiont 'TC1' of Trimyema compressum TaxID=243899 RepID=UPI0013923EE9|nr:sulfatase-like hydrolase/transferase [endosymbiont 'TC1' of Trimyema compressum]
MPGDKSTRKSTLEEFNGYLRNLKETDDSLRILMDYLKTRDKETIVVFYGDHQPRLEMFPYADSLTMEEKQKKDMKSGHLFGAIRKL